MCMYAQEVQICLFKTTSLFGRPPLIPHMCWWRARATCALITLATEMAPTLDGAQGLRYAR